jgi:mannose-6-phosphate isomerase-like protein (cupin superfamily)
MRVVLTIATLLIGTVPAWAQGQPTPPPPAPAPGSPAIFKSAAELAAVLQKAAPNAAGMLSSNVTTTDQYRVSLITRDKAAGALAHPGNTELLYIVEGEGTMVTGGKLIAAADGKPASVADGVSKTFVQGDVFIVPAGSPHWFSVVNKPVTYLEVRWLAPR